MIITLLIVIILLQIVVAIVLLAVIHGSMEMTKDNAIEQRRVILREFYALQSLNWRSIIRNIHEWALFNMTASDEERCGLDQAEMLEESAAAIRAAIARRSNKI